MRIFIGSGDLVDLTYLQEKIEDLGRFNFTNHFHLTFKFLGEIGEKEINYIKEKLKDLKFEPIKVKLNSVDYFPDEQYISVIWVGFESENELKELFDKIEDLLKEKFEKEIREFKPHITIARVKSVRDKEKLKKVLSNIENKEVVIDKLFLYNSELDKNGPKYEVLGEFNEM